MDLSILSRPGSPLRKKRIGFGNAAAYQKIMRVALIGLFFLFPVFFLPWTVEILETNKQLLLVGLSGIAAVAWLGGMVVEKKLFVRGGWVNLFPFLFLVATLVSSLFSLGGYQSWVGQSSQEYASFLSTACFVLLFYTVANTAGQAVSRTSLLSALTLGSALSAIVALIGALAPQILPFAFMQQAGFNTVGTVTVFTLTLIVVSTLILGVWIADEKGKASVLPIGLQGVLVRIAGLLVVASSLFFMLAIDFWVLWAVAMIGMALLLVLAFMRQTEFSNPGRFALPLFIIVVSGAMLFLPTPLQVKLPVVVGPSYQTSWEITRQTVSESPLRVSVGSGPGTFVFDYAKYRPQEINASSFWNIRFDRSKSQLLTTLATVGVVGLMAWVLFALVVTLRALARLMREKDHEDWGVSYAMFAAWVAVIASSALYSSNLTMQFLFWALAGLLAGVAMGHARETDFGRSPKLGLLFSFAFVVTSVGVLASMLITGQRYMGELAFARAVQLDRSQAPKTEVVQALAQAITANPNSDVLYRNMSQALLLNSAQMITDAGVPIDQMTPEQRTQIQQMVAASINAAQQATVVGPNNVANWLVRGNVYRDVMPLATNAEDFSAASYQVALQLEPLNPATYTSLGQLHLIVADRARSLKTSENAELAKTATDAEVSELTAAEEALTKVTGSIDTPGLKSDYAPAHYYLAAVYERQGKTVEATQRLAALVAYAPLDIGLRFQLAILLLRQEQWELAQGQLEQIVSLSPDNSNARWYLASVYEYEGDLVKARDQVREVARLNPDNEMVKERLAMLEAGKSSLEIPEPVEAGEEDATILEEGEAVVEDEEEVDPGTALDQ